MGSASRGGRTVAAVAVAYLLLACWGLTLASATFWCNGMESQDIYFVANVRKVVERMATQTAVHPELDYITQDPGPPGEDGTPQWTVYGKSKCKVMDSHACDVCLNDGWRKMDVECYFRFGAQYFTDECTMRYELFPDFGLL